MKYTKGNPINKTKLVCLFVECFYCVHAPRKFRSYLTVTTNALSNIASLLL